MAAGYGGGVTGSAFADASATNGTTYFYVVHAIVAGSESGHSVMVQSTITSSAAAARLTNASGNLHSIFMTTW